MNTQVKKIGLGFAALVVGVAGAALADDFIWSTNTQIFQGYSTNPQKSPDGQGTSSITRITTLHCPGGSINSCFKGNGKGGEGQNLNNLNPNTTVSTSTSCTGPGQSPCNKIFTNQGRLP